MNNSKLKRGNESWQDVGIKINLFKQTVYFTYDKCFGLTLDLNVIQII